jgi:hypothetical protein
MIQIVMKPVPGEGVVNRETLYTALFNGRDVGLRVRALRASHAEAKLMATFEKSVDDRKENGVFTIDFNLERWLEGKDKKDVGDQESGAAPEGVA